MFKKLNKKGFTLAELLIVVAIIGVLVAISIPIFTAQLEKAREATDLANLRSAYAGTAALLDGSYETILQHGVLILQGQQNLLLHGMTLVAKTRQTFAKDLAQPEIC